jgi:predicted small lipoprotein YifL
MKAGKHQFIRHSKPTNFGNNEKEGIKLKKLLTLLLCLALLFSLAACGSKTDDVEEETPEDVQEEPTEEPEEEEPAAEGTEYTYSETNSSGLDINWTLTLLDDGTYILSEVNSFIGSASYHGTAYTQDGDTVVCDKMVDGEAPGSYDWADPAGFTVTLSGSEFTPSTGEAAPADDAASNTYTYSETNSSGLHIDWTLELLDDGTYVLSEVNDFIGTASYHGTGYTQTGDVVVCDKMVDGEAPGSYDWADPAGFTVTLSGSEFTPGGDASTAAPAANGDSVAGTYTFSETNSSSLHIDWTLELLDDGTYVLSEKNDFIGTASYHGTGYTVDGGTIVCDKMVDGQAPGAYDWANPAGFTVTLSGSEFMPVR